MVTNKLDIIEKIIKKQSNGIVIDKEKLTEQMRKISIKIFNEFCNVYLDKIGDGKYILEVHFEDDNYYEIDISDTDTVDIFAENILKDFVNERFIDKESIGVNRNNERYFKKYCK
ncbi:MAG: hypothetical protein RIN55_10705 [Tissierellaceae bacterium]|nr:hypothetical protein [Tissierellaceae bacterium]